LLDLVLELSRRLSPPKTTEHLPGQYLTAQTDDLLRQTLPGQGVNLPGQCLTGHRDDNLRQTLDYRWIWA
ncbi:hypothetical protein Dimus_036952, partial [Dionaea muscipula]